MTINFSCSWLVLVAKFLWNSLKNINLIPIARLPFFFTLLSAMKEYRKRNLTRRDQTAYIEIVSSCRHALSLSVCLCPRPGCLGWDYCSHGNTADCKIAKVVDAMATRCIMLVLWVFLWCCPAYAACNALFMAPCVSQDCRHCVIGFRPPVYSSIHLGPFKQSKEFSFTLWLSDKRLCL